MGEPVPQSILERGRRTAARRAAAMLVGAMAETDASFAAIAASIGQEESVVRRWVHEMIDGCTGRSIEHMSDILVAMAAEPTIGAAPCRWVDRPEPPVTD